MLFKVTMLIGANVPEAQVHEEFRRGGSGEPYAVRTVLVGLCFDQLMLQILCAPNQRI